MRENARRASCQSNLHQLGLALTQYSQDSDERYPYGTQGSLGGGGGQIGIGWAGSLYSFVKSTGVYKCPDDSTANGANPSGAATLPVSYGYNVSAAVTSLSGFNSPAMTVLLDEVTNCPTDVTTVSLQGNTNSATSIPRRPMATRRAGTAKGNSRPAK